MNIIVDYREGTLQKKFEKIDFLLTFDSSLVAYLNVNIPIILSGGFGKVKDIIDASKVCDPDAVAFADALHYDKISIKKIREECLKANLEVRNLN